MARRRGWRITFPSAGMGRYFPLLQVWFFLPTLESSRMSCDRLMRIYAQHPPGTHHAASIFGCMKPRLSPVQHPPGTHHAASNYACSRLIPFMHAVKQTDSIYAIPFMHVADRGFLKILCREAGRLTLVSYAQRHRRSNEVMMKWLTRSSKQ
jgi:hypothetical protein